MRHVIFAVFLFWSCSLRAQFHAPATEFHDPVQRMFVPEMARVLAWLENLEAPGIVEIKYDLTTNPDGSSHWAIRWMEKDNKERFSTKVEYPASLLDKGPEFYRKVGADLMRPAMKNQLKPAKRFDVVDGYWRGARQMTFSREDSLGRALALAESIAEKKNDKIPDLAGLLAHAALGAVFERYTIDNHLSARAAAWMYLAERSCADSLDMLWAPILYLGGREKPAADLWKTVYGVDMPNSTPQEAGWNILLRQPISRDVYLFATKSENLTMGLPMMAIDAIANGSRELFVQSVATFVDRKNLVALHNFAIQLMDGNVQGGRIVEGYWPYFQRIAIVNLLDSLKPGPGDFGNYATELKTAKSALFTTRKFEAEAEVSLIGLKEFSGLIKLGHAEGVGPLAPVAVVTARDVLNYSWEISSAQMATRYRFLNKLLGVHEEAQALHKEALPLLEGSAPFFATKEAARTPNYAELQERLQLVDEFYHKVGWSPNPFVASSKADSADVFMKRSWGRPKEMQWQLRSLWDARQFTAVEKLLDFYRDQGGLISAAWAVNYLVKARPQAARFPKIEDYISAFADRMTQPTLLYLTAIAKKFEGLDHFKLAVAYEQLYWKNPDTGIEKRIYRHYLMANAVKSARRFYRQARENLGDPIAVSNGIGTMAFMHGYVAGDAQLRGWALEDSSSGSYSDFLLQIWDAAIRDDRKALLSVSKEIIERYEANDGADAMGKVLQKFLPLLPALANAKDPRHQEAIHSFDGKESWVVLRWIWARKFQLPNAETVQFIGGREADYFRRALAFYLEKDHASILIAMNKSNADEPDAEDRTILLNRLYDEIAPRKFAGEETDLKPKDAISTAVLLQKRAALLKK